MKMRIASVFLIFFITLAFIQPAMAEPMVKKAEQSADIGEKHDLFKINVRSMSVISQQYAAEALDQLGLFKGTGNGYELDKIPTRQEIAVMQIRLFGLESYALSKELTHPFIDVDPWAAPYVALLYNLGLMKGVSENIFGGQDYATAAQYLTLSLRALGYSDFYGDFSWEAPWTYSDMIGLTSGEYNSGSSFSRGDMAYITYNAMGTYLKDSNMVLFLYLKSGGVIPYSTSFPHPEWQPRIGISPDSIKVKKGSTAKVLITAEDPGRVILYTYPEFVDVKWGDMTSEIDRELKLTGLERGTYRLELTYAPGYGSKYSVAKLDVTVY